MLSLLSTSFFTPAKISPTGLCIRISFFKFFVCRSTLSFAKGFPLVWKRCAFLLQKMVLWCTAQLVLISFLHNLPASFSCSSQLFLTESFRWCWPPSLRDWTLKLFERDSLSHCSNPASSEIWKQMFCRIFTLLMLAVWLRNSFFNVCGPVDSLLSRWFARCN